MPEEQKVFSEIFSDGILIEKKSYKRKVWQDRITGDKWAFVQNGYWKLDETFVAKIEIGVV